MVAFSSRSGRCLQRRPDCRCHFLMSALSTVRADGRPHVTPLVAVWLDGALYFCTGEGEQKERNIRRNRIASSRPAATTSGRASIWSSRARRHA